MVQSHTPTHNLQPITNNPQPIAHNFSLMAVFCSRRVADWQSCACTTKQNRISIGLIDSEGRQIVRRALHFDHREISSLDHSEGHFKIVVVSSSMLRQWMVDWAMEKFTYTVDQDTIHRRYEQHISTTTIMLELTKIDNKLTKIVLKHKSCYF